VLVGGTHFDWPVVEHYSLTSNAYRSITGLPKQSKKPYNKKLSNLECLVFTGKSQTSALQY